MSKKKTAKRNIIINTSAPNATIQELQASRDGGQIALRGFTYQFLYSCYLILSESDNNTVFHLEGIEDIDRIKLEDAKNIISHVQLKYSTLKQDASFLKDVLKNFLEAYLLDKDRSFKLVYDFSVAKGNLSKLFDHSLDNKSTSYWKSIVEQIKLENPLWGWSGFQFDNFIKKLNFEKREKDALAEEIEKVLIRSYDITTDNLKLFANGMKICCLEKMEQRDSINRHDLDMLIQSIKDDISKGVQNPAHKWINKISFDTDRTDADLSYYEGKKPTPQDISEQLPVMRIKLEQEIEAAIQENRVTVIKASSGQGKTTMALQVAFDLKNEYTVYQLLWCNDYKELNNIVQFFRARVRLGEKPLIMVDNLDSQLSEWNRLAQHFQEEVSHHYKLLLTTREDDWYNYSGDLSNVKALQVIKLTLNEEEAKLIYDTLSKAHKLHPSVSNWRKFWTKVSDRKLLIEYVYLLTHGEMLSEKINHQIRQINKTDTGKIKCEILRKVCFADVCGIKLPLKELISSLLEPTTGDYGETLKSLENEFLIRVDADEKYIEGLHPVRSQHIVDTLHEFVEINDTALQVIKISDVSYFPKLFSNLPQIVINKKVFYSEIVDTLWNSNLSCYVLALRGLFSGSVMQYFHQNQHIFDEANEHGGLILIASELCPFVRFEEFGYTLNTLDEMRRITPDNANIQYLCNLRDTTPKLVLSETDVFCLCEALFNKLKDGVPFEITNDVTSYSFIAYWLLNINPAFNLSKRISLERIWDERENISVDVLSSLMYTCFCGNKEKYMPFVEENLSTILSYLKVATQSLKIYISNDKDKIYIEYILLPSDINKGNAESVSRLKTVCKTLPIFNTYCADSIKPTINVLSGYKIPDDAHKAMPIRNLIITFHQEFASLWNKTIMSNYECDSIFEWLDCWLSVRKNITALFEKNAACICRRLESKPIGSLASEIDNLRVEVNKRLIKEFKYPKEDRPFEEKTKIPEGFIKIKSDYFQSVRNICDQFAGFLLGDTDKTRLALINLIAAQTSLGKMQGFFAAICNEQELFQKEHSKLCILEEQSLQYLRMTCLYFKEHQPSKYFNKYQIKAWYNEYYKKTVKNAHQALTSLSTCYSIVTPQKYYSDGILNCFPIIAESFDLTNGELLTKFLCSCTPFAELDFDYLMVAFRNDYSSIMQVGLKIPKEFLKDLKTAIDTENAALAEQLTPPFPEDVSMRFLECFEQQYEIIKPIESVYKGIDKVAELLWAFSTSREALTSENDVEYRKRMESNLRAEIISLLSSFEAKIPANDYKELCELCNDVLSGQKFDDECLNAFVGRMIATTLN